MISKPSCEKAVKAVLADPKHPAFAAMWRAVSERGYGKAVQPMSNADGSNLTPANITVRLVTPDAGGS